MIGWPAESGARIAASSGEPQVPRRQKGTVAGSILVSNVAHAGKPVGGAEVLAQFGER